MVAPLPPAGYVGVLTEMRHVAFPPLPTCGHVGRFLSCRPSRRWARAVESSGLRCGSARARGLSSPGGGPSPGIDGYRALLPVVTNGAYVVGHGAAPVGPRRHVLPRPSPPGRPVAR